MLTMQHDFRTKRVKKRALDLIIDPSIARFFLCYFLAEIRLQHHKVLKLSGDPSAYLGPPHSPCQSLR